MNRIDVMLFLVTLIVGSPSSRGQVPERSATVAVLRQLGLADGKAIDGQLRQVNEQIRQFVVALPDDRTLYFSSLYLSFYGRAGEALPIVRSFLERQTDDGFIPASSGSRRLASPFLAQTVLLTSKERNEFTWLQEAPAGSVRTYYQRLQHFLDFWVSSQDGNGNGLPETGGDPLFFTSPGKVAKVESVALASYLHREYKAMIALAHQLRRPQDKENYQARARALADALNGNLWDEINGWYCDRDPGSGELMPGHQSGGWLPLFAGIATYERAGRLVEEYHRKAEPGVQHCFGYPQVWVPANYMIFQGLMDYGYRDLARKLAHCTFDLVFSAGPSLWSYYEAASGRGLEPATGGGWTALAYLMPWEYELNYTPSTLSWQPLLPVAIKYLGLAWEY